MKAYRYTECGLDDVVIEGVNFIVDDSGEPAVRIPNINGLHRAIALGIVGKHVGITGRELRFLRTEMGHTQAELATLLHREALTVSRWERGEITIDPNAEALVRLLAAEALGLEPVASVKDISRWCVTSAEPAPLVIDGSDTNDYRPVPVAA